MVDHIGLVPAAGQGTRLGLPFPKELYPIVDKGKLKPVSQKIIEQLTRSGISDIVMVINKSKYQLVSHFKSGAPLGANLIYVYQDNPSSTITNSTSPGLAHAIDSSFHVIKNKIVCFGMPDTIIYPEDVFSQALNNSKKYNVTLCLFPTNTPQKFGMVRTNRQGEVIEVIDKPNISNLKYMWGCIIWDTLFTDFLHFHVTNGVSDFCQILNSAIQDGIKVGSIKINRGKFLDIGTIQDIPLINKYLKSQDQ